MQYIARFSTVIDALRAIKTGIYLQRSGLIIVKVLYEYLLIPRKGYTDESVDLR
jgi:hypothetical protein